MTQVPFVKTGMGFCDDPLTRIAITVFVAGCPHNCPGCHSQILQDAKWGVMTSLENIQKKIASMSTGGGRRLAESVVYLGGDWLEYTDAYIEMAKWVHSQALENVLYTGKIFELIRDEVVQFTDWIVDGPFDKNHRGIFPSSTNQHVYHKGKRVDNTKLPLFHHLRLMGTSAGPLM